MVYEWRLDDARGRLFGPIWHLRRPKHSLGISKRDVSRNILGLAVRLCIPERCEPSRVATRHVELYQYPSTAIPELNLEL